MQPLNLPPFDYRTQIINGKQHIFDALRKKYLVLTPEEWVRQHFVHFLIEHRGYAKGLISCETGLTYNSLQKRSDILVYDRDGQPFMLVECKAASVKISQKVFEQVSIYNQTIKAPFIAVTNGLQTFVCSVDFDLGKVDFLEDFPEN